MVLSVNEISLVEMFADATFELRKIKLASGELTDEGEWNLSVRKSRYKLDKNRNGGFSQQDMINKFRKIWLLICTYSPHACFSLSLPLCGYT